MRKEKKTLKRSLWRPGCLAWGLQEHTGLRTSEDCVYVFLDIHTQVHGQMEGQRGQVIIQRVGLGLYRIPPRQHTCAASNLCAATHQCKCTGVGASSRNRPQQSMQRIITGQVPEISDWGCFGPNGTWLSTPLSRGTPPRPKNIRGDRGI